jgi:heat shock protein HslJ
MVQAAEIEDGQVVVKILIAGPGDPDCCPSHKAIRTYGLVDGRLSETAHEGQDLERVSASDLSGTTWNLVEMNYRVPVLPDLPVSIAFDGEQISGSGGCNNFTGSFTLGDVNPLLMTTGSLAATQKACPDAVLDQETSYFAALEGVVQWGYVFGRLVLYWPDEKGTLSRLLFAPVSTE